MRISCSDDRLDDATLWRVAWSHTAEAEMERYWILLDKNANNTLSEKKREELIQLRTEADQQMLRKVHAAALLQWRGYQILPAERL